MISLEVSRDQVLDLTLFLMLPELSNVRVLELVKEKIQKEFENSVDPKGQKWQSLSPRTIREKERHGSPTPAIPLMDTGEMFRSLDIVLGTGRGELVMDFPAEIHQWGTVVVPQREIFPDEDLPDEWVKDIEATIVALFVQTTKLRG